MITQFNLSDVEQKRAQDFSNKHKPHHGYFTYCFTPTGIGIGLTIKCSCGEEEDITDYDIW